MSPCPPGCSFIPTKRQASAENTTPQKPCCASDKEVKASPKRTDLKPGLGTFLFDLPDGTPCVVHHETLGDVVSSDCSGPTFYEHLVVVAEGASGLEATTALTDALIEKAEKVEPDTIKLYRWHIRHQYWRRAATITGRTLSSVILPSDTKKKILDDMEEFFSPDTKAFYKSHGVPFRRSYLFHGLPGAGKTSLVQGLATKFGRNICFMQPTHPEMTDDDLQSGMQRCPANSIIVLEDIDALFEKNRDNKNSKSALTFTGLLNALDGVGSSTGQIIILTTNFREQLDAALIRNGRVDMQVEFKSVDEEQCREMFVAYYPNEEEWAKKFSERVISRIEERGDDLASAGLQHFFIVNRKSSAEKAAENYGMIFEEIDSRRAEEEAAKEEPKVGQKCTAQFKGRGKFYPGEIAKVNSDGTVNVNFDDGDKERSIDMKCVRLDADASANSDDEDEDEDENEG
mmetsp:Transcript_29248/g.58410  ORF Transcript_29248/g.58410 Transcript_29248/m.58410 type:complete len:458 (-) Transcript_29248:95-1468(-)